MSSFLTELKRRRVFQVAIAYAAVGFVIAQAADIFFPGLQLPPWALTLVLALLVMGFPLAVALAWVFDITPEGVVRTPASAAAAVLDAPVRVATREEVRAPRPDPPPAAPERSVAVLPFVNMSSDTEQEYFSDGITEELLNVLAQIPGLRVAARTSAFAFKGQQVGVEEIARKLKVAHVLEGSVRKGGSRVRITAQLIEAEHGYHLWSESYDRDVSDVFAVQDEISREIASVLRCRILGTPAEREAPTRDVEAHNLYLKGRFCLNRMEVPKAIEHFAAAVEADPAYAQAHVALAEAYGYLADGAVPPLEVLPQIEEGCRRALELDPDLAEGHALLAFKELNWGWDWDRGRAALERALALNPGSSAVHWCAGFYGMVDRDFAAARDHLRIAQQLDPLSPLIIWATENVLLMEGDHEGVLRQHAVNQELARGFAYGDSWAGDAYRELGRVEEAIAAYRAAEPALGRPSAGLAVTLARIGRTGEAEEILRELEARFADGRYLPPEFIARIHLALGCRDDAFRWLERGVELRSAFAVSVQALWPEFEPLWSDERFVALGRRVGLASGRGRGSPMRGNHQPSDLQ